MKRNVCRYVFLCMYVWITACFLYGICWNPLFVIWRRSHTIRVVHITINLSHTSSHIIIIEKINKSKNKNKIKTNNNLFALPNSSHTAFLWMNFNAAIALSRYNHNINNNNDNACDLLAYLPDALQLLISVWRHSKNKQQHQAKSNKIKSNHESTRQAF